MKKLKTLLIFSGILLASTAYLSAQSCYQSKGAKLNYKYEDLETETKGTQTINVANVEKQNNQLLVSMSIPFDTSLNGITMEDISGVQYIYSDSDIKKVILLSGETLKNQVKDVTRSVFEQQNQPVNEEELNSLIEGEGELSFDLKQNASKGERIPDQEIKANMMFIKYTVSLSEGTYEGKEKVSTPAGDFDCVKVSYRMKMSGTMIPSVNEYITEWYSPQHGLIKSETRSKKGKILSNSLLDSVECPKN